MNLLSVRGLNVISRVISFNIVEFLGLAMEVNRAFRPWSRGMMSELKHAEIKRVQQWHGQSE